MTGREGPWWGRAAGGSRPPGRLVATPRVLEQEGLPAGEAGHREGAAWDEKPAVPVAAAVFASLAQVEHPPLKAPPAPGTELRRGAVVCAVSGVAAWPCPANHQ